MVHPSTDLCSTCSGGILKRYPSSISPNPAVIAVYVLAIYVGQFGFCLLLVLARKPETKVCREENKQYRTLWSRLNFLFSENIGERSRPHSCIGQLGYGWVGSSLGEHRHSVVPFQEFRILQSLRFSNGSLYPLFFRDYLFYFFSIRILHSSFTTHQRPCGLSTPHSYTHLSASSSFCRCRSRFHTRSCKHSHSTLFPPEVISTCPSCLCSITLGLTYKGIIPGLPIDYTAHPWPGFGVVFGTNLLGLIVIALRRDIVWCVAATWICASIWSLRPKPAPVYVRRFTSFSDLVFSSVPSTFPPHNPLLLRFTDYSHHIYSPPPTRALRLLYLFSLLLWQARRPPS